MVLRARTIALIVCSLTVAVQAAPPLMPQHVDDYRLDSGAFNGPPEGSPAALVYRQFVRVPDAPWLRVHLGAWDLGAASFLIFTSLEDGDSQRLDARTLPQWQGTTAYFNGDTVEIALYAAPGDQGVFANVQAVVVGERADIPPGAEGLVGGGGSSLCGADNRVASTDAAVGRINGCTAWLVSNGAVLTAGHCVDFDPDDGGPQLPNGILDLSGTISFNVPLSDADGTPNAAPANDQYPIDTSDVTWRFDGEGQGLGKDWAVFAIFPNSNTGLRAHVVQNFKRMTNNRPSEDSTVRITGYGIDETPAGSTGGRNSRNRTLQTNTGSYEGESSSGADIRHSYKVDTEGANSGSPIIWESNGFTIGIHTNAGCSSDGSGANSGTSFEVNALENAIAGFPGPNTVYVDNISNHPRGVFQFGTLFQPANTVAQAVGFVNSGGRISIVAGNYSAADGNVFTAGADGKSFFIEAPVGDVTIGN